MTAWNTVTEKISIRGYNNDEVPAYVARPNDGERHPGVVVIHHLPGWDAWTREVVRKFADSGYVAIAPHLHSRFEGSDIAAQDTAARPTWGPTDPEAMGDIAGSARWLKSQSSSNGKAGCIGFCSGGRYAYLAASQVDELDAAVDCWGGAVIPDERFALDERRPISPFGATKDIHMPLLGIFGNDDQFPTPEIVNQTEAALKEHRKDYEFFRYDGAAHGFWANATPGYRPQQTQESWKEVLRFFDERLSG